MSSVFYDFSTIFEKVAHSIDALVLELFPGAKRHGASYRTGDENGEKGRSFSISTRPNNAGCFVDYADQSVKGNAIGLVALAKGMSYQDAGEWLAKWLNIAPREKLEMPKKRPEPKINYEKKTIQVSQNWELQVHPLNDRVIQYAESRGITAETLRDFRISSADEIYMAMPHFDVNGRMVMMKLWSCDGQKKILSNLDPVPVLFGKHRVDPLKSGGILIITEGQWDAMSWGQLGYPAVSIPNGVNNEDWISEDWTFLNQFSEIYLDFDDDAAGHEAEARAKQRLGFERCKAIRYGYKDANEALQAGDEEGLHSAFKNAEDAPIERIIVANNIKSAVRDRLNKSKMKKGIAFFLPKLPFEFRPNEMTLWFGLTSHGKSTVLSNQIAFCAYLGELSMVASFEQATPMTMAAMMVQYTANPDIGESSSFDEAYDELASRVLFYDSMAKADPDELVATMTMAHKQLGVTQFVIDNVMTLEVDRQDNTAQAGVADKFRVFAARYPVHLHLVAHPRKPKDDATKPPSVQEIRGASEWGDMPHNIITVFRDVDKAQRLAAMEDDASYTPDQIQELRDSCPDGKVFIRKQRETGDLPMISYFFDKGTKRAWKDQEDAAPYWFPPDT